ncbi:hypothetical protein EJ02DRAFT_484961 [Clathrospora elynae]|uniref:DUF7820 domain-containing protein n=1 Tax=Clathrospora elynae TaxID=706981 RepID=A0A6A5SVE9_9PLEO|nr:hypothetical protein EJ02DRAFT_484961 [Clathrospora elynae]
MRLPYRSISSIQALPSIYTTFPTHYDNNQSSDTSGINSGTCFIRQIEDGIEVVPFERSNALSAPILSPAQDEKEVVVFSQKEMDAFEKPLPTLPRSIWSRMSLRQRILALLGIQFLMLMTIGLALMAAKGRSSHSNEASTVRVASDGHLRDDTTNHIRRGIFALPIQIPQQQISACLARMNESVAWQCVSDTTLQLNILPAPAGDDATTMITIGPPLSNDSVMHGHQIPNIGPVELAALGDTTGDGPVYHFSTTYDRVVLLRDNDLMSMDKPNAQPLTRHPIFLPGENLWQCNFNESFIEGYIYVGKPTTPEIASTGDNMVNATTMVRLLKVPYVVKLVEQRMPNGKAPYCEKMIVQTDSKLVSRSERVMLDLSDPEAEVEASTSKSPRFWKRQQAQAADYCRCQWLIQ